MSEERAERVLRAVLAERAVGLDPAPDLAYGALRRHRIRVRLLVAAAAAAAVLVAAGIPAGLTALRADAPPATPAPEPSAAACDPLPRTEPEPTPAPVPVGELPRPTGVRGSLAGDRALADAVLVLGWQGLQGWSKKRDMQGKQRTMDVRTLQLRFVERAGSGVVALVTADDTTGRWQAAQWVLRENGTLLLGETVSDMVDDVDFERRTGQLFSGDDPLLITSTTVCGAQYGVVLAPRDATAAAGSGRSLPLAGGLAVFALPPGPDETVTVSRAGRTLGAAELLVSRPAPATPIIPEALLDQAVRDYGGPVDRPTADVLRIGLIAVSPDELRGVPVTGMRVLWSGTARDGKPVVVAAALRSDGSATVAAARSRGATVEVSAAQVESADGLDGSVIALHLGNSLLVVAPRAARAEVGLPDGSTRPVALTRGGGTTPLLAATARRSTVRAYAADESLIREVRPIAD